MELICFCHKNLITKSSYHHNITLCEEFETTSIKQSSTDFLSLKVDNRLNSLQNFTF